MIKFENVSFSYGNGAASIKNLNFEIKKGEFVAICGENGAGKSTTSKLINGLLKPSVGTVTTAGFDTRQAKASTLASHIGFLFQNPDRQLCCNSVQEEINFSLNIAEGMSKEDKAARIEKMCSMFSLDKNADPFSLSRGEKQKAALASVLVLEPEILVLDEPTTGLDYKECTLIMDFVKQLNIEKDITVVMVCHDMEVVLDYAQRLIAMANGEIVDDDNVRSVFGNSEALKKAALLPPQITDLALRLGGRFENCSRAEEIVECLKNR